MKIENLIQSWGRIRQGLLETINKFSDTDLDYIPFEGSYSVRQTMLHIAQEERGEVQYGLTYALDQFPAAYPEAEFPTLETVKALLENVHGQTVEYIRSLHDADLQADLEAQWGQTRPLIDFLAHVIEHEIHHRGELSLMLGMLGREGLDA